MQERLISFRSLFVEGAEHIQKQRSVNEVKDSVRHLVVFKYPIKIQ